MEELTLGDKEFVQFRDLIYKLTGISLNDGKRQLVESRLQKRLRVHRLASFGDYYALLGGRGGSDAEITAFINCITTNKTDFCREPHHFHYVTDKIIPALAAEAREERRTPRLRVWHAGCSSGEEPYTLGIALAEALKDQPGWDIHQLASDIDTDVLNIARKGEYAAERVAPIPQDHLSRHFQRGGTADQALYQVKSPLRAQVTFQQINLLQDWPLRADLRFDAIFCRNVIIYFDKPTQQRLFARFQERLRPGGHLFLGHSESMHGQNDSFDSVGHTIYRLREPVAARQMESRKAA